MSKKQTFFHLKPVSEYHLNADLTLQADENTLELVLLSCQVSTHHFATRRSATAVEQPCPDVTRSSPDRGWVTNVIFAIS